MKFYVIGSREIVLAFNMVGVDGVYAETRDEVLDAFNRATGKLGESNLPHGEVPRVLILTEDAAALIEDEEYAWQKTGKYPLIVEVPGLQGHLEGKKSLSDAIREAVGIQIQFLDWNLMEELRSTEILDKEIVADAQKKAERIASKAGEECKKIAASVEARVQEEISKTEDNLNLKLKNFERDLNASIPLEKSRFYVSYVQDSVVKNINEYLSTVQEEKIITLLVNRCKKVDFSYLKLKAYVYGLDEKKTETALKVVLGTSLCSTEKTEFNKIIFEESVLSENKGIILISENEEVKCRFSLSQVIEEVLDKKRAELSESLFEKISE